MDNNQALTLAEKYSTPLFIYDADIMERQYKRLINSFNGIKIEKLFR